jgi:hypothetical protein
MDMKSIQFFSMMRYLLAALCVFREFAKNVLTIAAYFRKSLFQTILIVLKMKKMQF